MTIQTIELEKEGLENLDKARVAYATGQQGLENLDKARVAYATGQIVEDKKLLIERDEKKLSRENEFEKNDGHRWIFNNHEYFYEEGYIYESTFAII